MIGLGVSNPRGHSRVTESYPSKCWHRAWSRGRYRLVNRGRQGHWVQGKIIPQQYSRVQQCCWNGGPAPAYARCASVVTDRTKHETYPSTGRAGDGGPTSCGFTFRDASSPISVHSPLFFFVATFFLRVPVGMFGEIRIFGFDRRRAKPLMREVKRAHNQAKGLVRMGVSWSDGRLKADSPFHAVLEISWIVSHCDGDSCGRSQKRQEDP